MSSWGSFSKMRTAITFALPVTKLWQQAGRRVAGCEGMGGAVHAPTLSVRAWEPAAGRRDRPLGRHGKEEQAKQAGSACPHCLPLPGGPGPCVPVLGENRLPSRHEGVQQALLRRPA